MKVIPNQCNINEYQSSIFSIIENNRKILLNAGKTVKRGKTLSTTMTKYKIKINLPPNTCLNMSKLPKTNVKLGFSMTF
jgi:hypothetical protein